MKKVFDFVYSFYLIVCKLLFIITVVVTSYVVFGRFALNKSPVWGEEIVLTCMVYMAFISAALALRTDSHIRMTMIDYVVSDKMIKVLKLISNVLIACFALVLIVYGWRYAYRMRIIKYTGLKCSQILLYLSVPFSGVAMLFMQLEKMLGHFEKNAMSVATKEER